MFSIVLYTNNIYSIFTHAENNQRDTSSSLDPKDFTSCFALYVFVGFLGSTVPSSGFTGDNIFSPLDHTAF